MSHAGIPNSIDYLEFVVTDVATAKDFYSKAFGWTFEEWGPDYVSFHVGNAKGGFTTGEPAAHNNPLAVIYSDNLAAAQKAVEAAGGTIVKPIFEFPGGKRFHFKDTVGNTLAVWSE